ncbi:MAG: nucleotide sugar dehydrogenase [Deltaproteobacteria bacterium]|jgi:UDPglucose 6-dehydrogenase|nr:nucleotide sugar dehydrogenase [Deltaproteobacteria bacterium]
MRIAVLGLWHLGTVTAAGAAALGHNVIGWDRVPQHISAFNKGLAPIFEPGLNEQLKSGLASGNLTFTDNMPAALKDAELAWICHDTPVNEDDIADPESVIADIKEAIPLLPRGTLILVSSQLPAGTCSALSAFIKSKNREDLDLACSPENLRLGNALEIFSHPERVVCGISSARAKAMLTELFQPMTGNIVWMSVPSAEMTKHAINAFLATSVSFANEIASLCEFVGADAKEVEKGLKSEKRIGPGAYLSPGQAFAGGTLARDLTFLDDLGKKAKFDLPVIEGARVSNELHKNWIIARLKEKLKSLDGKLIAMWGLAYKPGTDTLRRSSSLETAGKLLASGASVAAHDPAVKQLPDLFKERIKLSTTALDAVKGADALVICTPWPDYSQVDKNEVLTRLKRHLILDPSGFLREVYGADSSLEYVSIGYAPANIKTEKEEKP